MTTVAEKIAVMQASLDGAPIQYRGCTDHAWRDTGLPVWAWEGGDYRVKPPEPVYKTLYLVLDYEGDGSIRHKDKASAERRAAALNAQSSFAPYTVCKVTYETRGGL